MNIKATFFDTEDDMFNNYITVLDTAGKIHTLEYGERVESLILVDSKGDYKIVDDYLYDIRLFPLVDGKPTSWGQYAKHLNIDIIEH